MISSEDPEIVRHPEVLPTYTSIGTIASQLSTACHVLVQVKGISLEFVLLERH